MKRADVLLVDDDENVLSGLRRVFSNDFTFQVASDGDTAIALTEDGWQFRAVVSDHRMQGKDGIQTLAAIKALQPATSRILLTGHADKDVLHAAINQAGVFRVLEKPCKKTVLEGAIIDAISEHDAVTRRQKGVERSVLGTILALRDILAGFGLYDEGRNAELTRLSREIALASHQFAPWELDAALSLSKLADLHGIAQNTAGESRDPMAAADFSTLVLTRVPHLVRVSEAIHYRFKNYDGSGTPANLISGETIPALGRALRVLTEYSRLREQGLTQSDAIADMGAREHQFDRRFLAQLKKANTELQDNEKDTTDHESEDLAG